MKYETEVDLTLEEMETLLKALRMYIAFSPANHSKLAEKLVSAKKQLKRLVNKHG